MAEKTVTGIVISVKRLGCTVSGNPMHEVTLRVGTHSDDNSPMFQTFRISNDASLNYGINNQEYREEPHTFVLTRAHRISQDI